MSRPVLVLLGSPVRHSASPAIYRAAFRALGIDATYRSRRVDAAGLLEALRAAAAGGGGNVTAPHKERAALALDTATQAVRATGACNCFWALAADGRGLPEGRPRLAGDNTDVEGFLAAVRELPFANGLRGARVLVLGAGGAARAVVHACLIAGAEAVDVRNRTAARAETLVRELAPGDPRTRALPWDGEATDRYDLAVNATSLGRSPSDPAPPDAERLGAAAALDLVYAPGGTAWVRSAAAAGLPAADGLEMLIRQAARSLQRWFPAVEPPLEAMRTAGRRSLALRDARQAASPEGLR